MVTLDDVLLARDRIKGKVIETPVIRAHKLEKLFNGAQIYLKLENFQIAGSFKIRGAVNKIFSLSKDQISKGIVAASSGNHAQAVAYTSSLVGSKAIIIMPNDAPKIKVEGTKYYGAEVILYGYTGEDREGKAFELANKNGSTFINSHADPYVISGQGTAALEFMNQVPDLDVIITPCGGGGLTSGTLISVCETNKHIKVIAVEPKGVPRFTESLKNGKPVTVPLGQTLADGLRVSKADDVNFEIIKKYGPEIILQDDRYILEALKEMLLMQKILIEPSSAIVFAAMMNGKIDTSMGKKIGVIISGGNIDGVLLKKIL